MNEDRSTKNDQQCSEDLFSDMDSVPGTFCENELNLNSTSQPPTTQNCMSNQDDTEIDQLIISKEKEVSEGLERMIEEELCDEEETKHHYPEEHENEHIETDSDMPEANTVNIITSESKTVSKKMPEIKLLNLPAGRVKNIMKLDPDVHLISNEAIVLVTKATELFIKSLSKECMVHKDPKKKTIQKRDIDQVFSSADSLSFLEGALDF